MHIGIDLDNTVLDATTAHLTCYNKVSGLSLTAEDVSDFYIYRMYGWDQAERNQIYHRHGHDIHSSSVPYPLAPETIRNLYSKHQITIMTARPAMFRDVTVKWLDAYGIPYHNIVFTENKRLECEAASVDVLIDDAPHYANEFALLNRPYFLFHQPYNTTVQHEQVRRIFHWSEVEGQLALINSILSSQSPIP
nr:hypothetical protein [Paenibacillus oenotherae]